ncbi:MAG: TIM barrel protein [Candidatus Latescibacteria bacterium]|nr:TIM barrel protein [Candidatus Latescibacterota bacterium]
MKHRLVFLADLHLSERDDTAAAAVLQWAIEQIETLRPDAVVVGGDMTTYAGVGAATRLVEALEGLEMPVLQTLGNAEHRGPAARPVLAPFTDPARRWLELGEVLVLAPDTSTGALPAAERAWLQETAAGSRSSRVVVCTHYPLDVLEADSQSWLRTWLQENRVELLVAGHRHTQQQQQLGTTTIVVVRGLDPDKAMGDWPGLDLFASEGPGKWDHRPVAWTPPLQLLPAQVPGNVAPVGWSIHADPVEAVHETLEYGLSCLELRPPELNYSRPALAAGLRDWRAGGPSYLSYHLPGLTWDEAAADFADLDAVRAHLDRALEVQADSLTMHVPQAPARLMAVESPVYAAYLEAWEELFAAPVQQGMRLAIENVHNPPATPLVHPERKFATSIEEYTAWIEAVEQRLASGRNEAVGALFDVGHARNNGGELDNSQPLGDWYARVGARILGYHIHQVNRAPQNGRLANHLEIDSFFGGRISYAGFWWAWSTGQIRRAPLFIEIRDHQARRRTARRFLAWFSQGVAQS